MSGRRAVEVGTTGRNVAANLLRLRKIRGFSTRQLSGRLGEIGRPIPASGITRMEHCERRIDVDDLVGLATALDVEPSQLMLAPSELTIEVFVGGGGETR
jgi:transcriptional regulator with XRE-family HTH domain